MTKKTAEAYEAVFSYIEDNIFHMRPAMFMADFEGGIRKAINNFYPDSALHGCWYHFSAAIRRKFLRLNLYEIIKKEPEGKILYKMMLNLPLLPPEEIAKGFNIIKRKAQNVKLSREFRPVFAYFENFWLELVRLSKLKLQI